MQLIIMSIMEKVEDAKANIIGFLLTGLSYSIYMCVWCKVHITMATNLLNNKSS